MHRVSVPENRNVQGRHLISPTMVIETWSENDGTSKPRWVRNRTTVNGDAIKYRVLVPWYRVWAELEENASTVSGFGPHRIEGFAIDSG